MAIEIVDVSIKNGNFPYSHSYVSHYQRVMMLNARNERIMPSVSLHSERWSLYSFEGFDANHLPCCFAICHCVPTNTSPKLQSTLPATWIPLSISRLYSDSLRAPFGRPCVCSVGASSEDPTTLIMVIHPVINRSWLTSMAISGS